MMMMMLLAINMTMLMNIDCRDELHERFRHLALASSSLQDLFRDGHHLLCVVDNRLHSHRESIDLKTYVLVRVIIPFSSVFDVCKASQLRPNSRTRNGMRSRFGHAGNFVDQPSFVL